MHSLKVLKRKLGYWLQFDLEVHLHAVLVGSPISAIVKDPVTDRALGGIIIIVVVGHPL